MKGCVRSAMSPTVLPAVQMMNCSAVSARVGSKPKMESVLVQVTPVVTISSLSTMMVPAIPHQVGGAELSLKHARKSTIPFVAAMERATAMNVLGS